MLKKTKKTHSAKFVPKKKEPIKEVKSEAAPTALAEAKPIRSGSTPETLRGMRDILPSEQKYWQYLTKISEQLAQAYGYERIETPILEETALFVRTAGKQSDVVEKEMFTFLDKAEESVTLRPEGTAGVARAYINHGMINLPQPVKLFYWGPMFRYERPQHGRYREHHQVGFESFGDANPVLDAELIFLASLFYKEIGIKTVVHINSLGCNVCRQNYLNTLSLYYRPKRNQLCEDCKRRFAKNPLRLLDCKEEGCQPIKEGAPNLVDHLDEECKNHFMRVLEVLDDLQVSYELDHQLVRGFDYYTRTVFELVGAEEIEGKRSSLGGGGRYDNLIEQLGGRATPACGFGAGIERAILEMKALQIEPPVEYRADIFLAQLGDAARRKAFILFEELRSAHLPAAANFAKNSLKGQLEIANRMGAKYTLILGQKEVLDGTILLRDMESGMQEIIDITKAVSELKKKLSI